MRLYKFYGADSALRNLEQQRLKVSTLDDINDPFEWNSFRLKHRKDREIWRNLRKTFWADKGLVSFSDRWSNPVLWSHYADKHKGLALGFDIPKKHCMKVEYENNLADSPSLEEIHASKDGSIFLRATTTKYVHWEYETEWRVIVSRRELSEHNGLLFSPFSQDLQLKEIVIGSEAIITSAQLRKIVRSKIKISTARLAFNTFKVTPQLDKNFQK